MMNLLLPLMVSVLLLFPGSASPQAASDWRGLVEHLTGDWDLSGQVMEQKAHHRVHAEWVFNRQFLRIDERTTPDAPKSERHYEAVWFLGYDTVSDRYVMHLLDGYGGRFSETLGYGVRQGDEIVFVFEYPDGPFHTTFSWHQKDHTWEWLMNQKDKAGKWAPFAQLELARRTIP